MKSWYANSGTFISTLWKLVQLHANFGGNRTANAFVVTFQLLCKLCSVRLYLSGEELKQI